MRRWAAGAVWLTLAAPLGFACSVAAADDDEGSGGSRPPGPTELCEQSCVPMHPEGESAYRALRQCLLCRACASLCAPTVGDLCEPQPELDGCSAGWGSCEQCAESPCALQQQPDTTFVGTCAPEGSACLQSPGCVSLNNCVATCVTTEQTSAGAGGAAGG